MKKILLVLMAFAIMGIVSSTSYAVEQNYITFNDPTSGNSINVYSFDWNVGNALSVGVVPPDALPIFPNVQPFTLYYQATLGNFLDINGNAIQNTGLNNDYEITALIAFGEVATIFAPNSPNANFFFDPTNSTNYAKLFLDTNIVGVGETKANNLEGTGFTEGDLLFEGTVVNQDGTGSVITGGNFTADLNIPAGTLNVSLFDQFNDDDYLFPPVTDNPDWGTVTGTGSTRVVVDVDESTVDSSYFNPTLPFLLAMELLSTGNQVTPFIQQDPSRMFWDAAANAWVIPVFGDCSGGGPACETNSYDIINGSTMAGATVDFQFQADANSAIRLQRETPEPASILLIGTGLLGFGIGMRRRKK